MHSTCKLVIFNKRCEKIELIKHFFYTSEKVVHCLHCRFIYGGGNDDRSR